jgi:hypothetical protein
MTRPQAHARPAATPRPRAKLSDDERLAELQARHAARWDIWLIRCSARNWWCVRPAGGDIGVHREDTPESIDAWLRRIDALTGSGFAITFHPTVQETATVTWTSPGSTTPTAYGPAPTPDVLTHAEDIRACRIGLTQWLTERPEETARHMSREQVQGFLPLIADDSARRVLEAMLSENREHYLAQPPTGPLARWLDRIASAEAQEVPSAT